MVVNVDDLRFRACKLPELQRIHALDREAHEMLFTSLSVKE